MISWFSSLFRNADRTPARISPRAETKELPLVREYLIRRTDGEWFELPKEAFEEILRPDSFEAKTVEGWGDHRIKVRNSEIRFSYEDPGIQVSFYGTGLEPEESAKIVAEIANRITRATKQGSSIVAL